MDTGSPQEPGSEEATKQVDVLVELVQSEVQKRNDGGHDRISAASVYWRKCFQYLLKQAHHRYERIDAQIGSNCWQYRNINRWSMHVFECLWSNACRVQVSTSVAVPPRPACCRHHPRSICSDDIPTEGRPRHLNDRPLSIRLWHVRRWSPLDLHPRNPLRHPVWLRCLISLLQWSNRFSHL